MIHAGVELKLETSVFDSLQQRAKGMVTWREEVPSKYRENLSRWNTFALGSHAEIPFRVDTEQREN